MKLSNVTNNLSMSSFNSQTPGTSAGSSDLGPGDDGDNESDNVAPNNEHKTNCVPKLIDNKRKHLQKKNFLLPRGMSCLLKKLQQVFLKVLKVLVKL